MKEKKVIVKKFHERDSDLRENNIKINYIAANI